MAQVSNLVTSNRGSLGQPVLVSVIYLPETSQLFPSGKFTHSHFQEAIPFLTDINSVSLSGANWCFSPLVHGRKIFLHAHSMNPVFFFCEPD